MKSHRGSIKSSLPAWILSLLFHAGLLYGFSLMAIEPRGLMKKRPAGQITVQQIEQLLRSEPVTAKPIVQSSPRLQTSVLPSASPDTVFEAADLSTELFEVPVEPELEFFGQKTEAHRIAFVVDCSGSMFGQMGLVKDRLRRAVHALKPDQFFSVVFFSDNGRIEESGDGALRRATAGQKQKALELIDSVVPEGQTQALGALRKALALREPGRGQVETIYFLTDGFDLEESTADDFIRQVIRYRAESAPNAVIYPIGCWTETGDREVLEMLAALSGGESKIVEESLPVSSDE